MIERQRLYNDISGKRYVKVEGWLTLGSMLGIFSREKRVTELADGSFEAIIELFNPKLGIVVGEASSICGVDEARWKRADKYARRSMAITRATGKAYRMTFSWIMSLAGYEGTPEEEMPEAMRVVGSSPPAVRYDPGNGQHKTRLVIAAKKAGATEKDNWIAISDWITSSYPNGALMEDIDAIVAEAWTNIKAKET